MIEPLTRAPMELPRWFLVVFAACLLTITLAFTIRFLRPEHDWQHDTDNVGAFDRKTGTWCYYNRNTAVYYCSDLAHGRPMILRH